MQIPLESSQSWRVETSEEWDVLGPFPIHAREQHFLSPAFPLNLSEVIDWERLWPSSYSDGGQVGWTKTTSNAQGELQIAFPDIRWKYLRAFEGWAVLQHHVVLRTTLKVLRKPGAKRSNANLPNLLVHLKQGSYFTILPKEPTHSFTPKWHAGNIYDLDRSLPHLVSLPTSETGEFQLFVSGDYEIRLFGDPDVQGVPAPTQHIKLEIEIEAQHKAYVHEPALTVVPAFVAGHAFGDAIGVAIRSINGWLSVNGAILADPPESLESLEISLLNPVRIAPYQARVIPLRLAQTSPFVGEYLTIVLTIETIPEGTCTSLSIKLSIRQLKQWANGAREPIIGSFFFAQSTPSVFSALPPSGSEEGRHSPPIVALHGAGVDILSHRFWADAMPPNKHGWILMPTGRTSWGLDWHGPSTQDVWESLSALSQILSRNELWKKQGFPASTRVILIGHSNGGQGTWHIASRFPDRIVAAIPAAAYIKSQAYIPLTQSRSAHFIDPALRSVLESSLTPDDNDLHVPNLLHIPILAINGGADENVPSWHSRELVNTIRTLSHTLGVENRARLREEPGKGHWYPEVLNNEEVQTFLSDYEDMPLSASSDLPKLFNLTVFNPTESGSLCGFKIQNLVIPGRLGRIRAELGLDKVLTVTPSNVLSFSVTYTDALKGVREIVVEYASVRVPDVVSWPIYFKLEEDGDWHVSNPVEPPVPTRIQSILSSSGPLTFVYTNQEDLSLATRLAHDLQLYHRIDSQIIPEAEAIRRHRALNWGPGNIVVLGTPRSEYVVLALEEMKTAFEVDEGSVHFQGKPLKHKDRGYLFLHPHPTSGGGYMLFMIYTTQQSLERLGKLFPIRTGVAVPTWLILGPSMDQLGAAGLEGAGIWDAQWQYKESSSYLL